MVKTRGAVRLENWMKEKGLRQVDVAQRLQTHQTNVSAWLLGRPIPLKMAVAIRKLTKIPVEEWVEEESADDAA